ncbi:phosphatase PAP2 family protein [Burkholderia ubonensis]|uniref:phosphatase PAP2 family protein n=1 Tax=Burkholderia ubonensis TaxID=101571 RepID=UPI0009B2FA9A|nr:phosphatase PAP2 family protein [Burkholderia ubonensis]
MLSLADHSERACTISARHARNGPCVRIRTDSMPGRHYISFREIRAACSQLSTGDCPCTFEWTRFMRLLMYLTNFGDPYLTIPLAGLILAWLTMTRSMRASFIWMSGMAISGSIVAASRVAHVIWGMQVSALNFTVVSGHTMLASAVYPTALFICEDRTCRTTAIGPYVCGLAFASAIGVSRVLLGFHSTSEVISGLLPGVLVAMLTCEQLARSHAPRARTARLTVPDPTPFAAAALAAVILYHGKIAPISASIDRNAAELSQWGKTQVEKLRQ